MGVEGFAGIRQRIVEGTCEGVVDSGGIVGNRNIYSNPSCEMADSRLVTPGSALSGPLTDNGGPTASILPRGQAIDFVFSGLEGRSTLEEDQRGQTRLVGGACDAGAVELQP